MNLTCAICLIETIDGDRDLRAHDAITIANGHAVCLMHLNQTRRHVNTSGGGVALGLINDPRFRPA